MADGPWITTLIDADGDRDGWDVADTGQPGISLFANAVQVWAMAQTGLDVTVADAALAFNVAPELIRQAVDYHYWMAIGAGDIIEHEGE